MQHSTPAGATDRSTNANVTEDAGARAQDAKKQAADQASSVAGTARDKADAVKGEAAQQTRRIANEARDAARRQANEQTSRAASALQRTGDQLQALADGRSDETGPLGSYVEQAATRVHSWAELMESRGIDGLLDDVQRFARRRPGAFLIGAAAAGLVAGRLARNAGGDSHSSNSTQGTPAIAIPEEAGAPLGDRSQDREGRLDV